MPRESTSKEVGSKAARIVQMEKPDLEAFVATDEGFEDVISVAASAWGQREPKIITAIRGLFGKGK